MKNLVLTITMLFGAMVFAQCPPNGFVFDTQQKVDEFAILYPNCTGINLLVDGEDVVNLNGLLNITTISEFYITNTLLSNLNGLDNVTSINGGDFLLENNALLTNMDAVSNMTGTVCALYFYIENNPLLESLQPLSGVEFLNFGGCFDTISWGGILNNDSLTNLEGIENITLPNYFTISNNESLESFEGFDSSIRIGGAGEPGQQNSGVFRVENNPSLTTIDNLSQVVVVQGGWITIKNNPLLESVEIDGIVEGGNHTVNITNNPLLDVCSGSLICKLGELSTQSPPKAVLQIWDNATCCDSGAVVIEKCALGLDNEVLQTLVRTFPNPVSKELNIELDNILILQNTKIHSVVGELVLSTKNNKIDLSALTSGIYFIEIATDEGSVIKKIIKN